MIKHLQSLASSRDLTCRKLKKKNMIKQLSEFKTVKTFIGSLMVKQTNKQNPGFCIERWESKISVFSFSINLMSHMYLATSERTQPSQVPSVLVWLWILGQNSFPWILQTNSKHHQLSSFYFLYITDICMAFSMMTIRDAWESKNDIMTWVQRDLRDHLVPIP